MAFILRLLFVAVLFAVCVIVLLATAYLIVLLINRGLQWGAENIGGELGNMFSWLRERMPKIKIERKANEENPVSRKTL